MPNDSFAWTPFRSHAKKVRYKKEREKRIKRNTVFHLGKYVNEPSGAVYDPNQEVMWSVGDSGDLILGRTNIKSQTTIKVPIKGNIARDREELVMDKQGYLWVLSIGDNKRNRKNVEINQLDPNQYYTDGKLDVIKKIKFTYPYGAIDVEGAFIFENKLYLIQKTFFKKAWIYTIDISPEAATKQVATRFKRLKSNLARLITAACIDQNDEVYVQTYWGTFRLKNWQTSRKIWPKLVKFDPFVLQAETIVCHEDKLIIGRETGRFWWQNK